MNVESELKDIINRLYDIQDVSGPDLSKKIYEIILQCREAIGYRKAELDRVQSSRQIKSGRIEYDNTSGEEIEISKEADDIASTIESTEDLLEFLQDYNVDLGSDNVYVENDRVITDSDGWTDDCSIAMYVQNVMDNFVKNTEIKDNNVKIYFVARDPNTKKYYGYKTRRKPEAVGVGEYRSYPEAKIGDVIDKDCKIIDICQDPDSNKLEDLIYLTDNIEKASYYGSVSEVKQDYPQAEAYQVFENTITSSRKPIKSSLENRLIPYLEEFEEGYANALASTDEMGPQVRLDTFYEIFKSDHNLSDDDINKLKDSVEGIWEESKEM